MEGLRRWLSARAPQRGEPPGRALPLGVDEVRLVETADALRLAELAGLLATLDQAIEAMRTLATRRGVGAAPSPDPLTDLALLRFAMTQFVSCFKGRRVAPRLTPRQAFGPQGVQLFDHVAVFADQLSGSHARVVGQAETVVLLKRAGDRAGVIGLTIRARRPERLTITELTNLADFMTRGRDAYAAAFEQMRARVMSEVQVMPDEDLLALSLLEADAR